MLSKNYFNQFNKSWEKPKKIRYGLYEDFMSKGQKTVGLNVSISMFMQFTNTEGKLIKQ